MASRKNAGGGSTINSVDDLVITSRPLGDIPGVQELVTWLQRREKDALELIDALGLSGLVPKEEKTSEEEPEEASS